MEPDSSIWTNRCRRGYIALPDNVWSKFVMRGITLWTLTIFCMIVALSTVGSASPATRLLDRDAGLQTTNVERVDYYWNHHRYKHRSWDKRHRRWRYY
jgi:hypothetical protein